MEPEHMSPPAAPSQDINRRPLQPTQATELQRVPTLQHAPSQQYASVQQHSPVLQHTPDGLRRAQSYYGPDDGTYYTREERHKDTECMSVPILYPSHYTTTNIYRE
jgi:hypothetical protein